MRSSRRRAFVICFGWLVVGLLARADDAAPQTGDFQLTFTTRDPLSAAQQIMDRMGWNIDVLKQQNVPLDYTLADETFQVHVPSEYTGKEPYGLLVWINAGPNGHIPQMWHDMLAKHRLIAVGADHSGNDRPAWIRMALALDAASNMKARYKIDERRVYVGGGSGGGRVSSHMGVGYPDVFRGGFYMIGVNFYRVMRLPDGKPGHWGTAYLKPRKELFRLTRERTRHVLLTGDDDPNREQTQAYSKGFQQDGFKFVTYFQVPGMGHSLPNAEWFEKGILALDEPLKTIDEGAFAPTTKPTATTRPTSAAPSSKIATKPPIDSSPDAEAARLLRSARPYIASGLYDKARERLKFVIANHPNSAAAKEALEMLEQIKDK